MADVIDMRPTPFDPNDGNSGLVLPTNFLEYADAHRPLSAAEYVTVFERQVMMLPTGLEGFEVAKAGPGSGKGVPTAYTYGHISYMPDPQSNGIIEYPGIQPSALKKVVKENVVPQMIIGMRCADVTRYSQLSDNLWKPGWRIEIREKGRSPNADERKAILEAEKFLANSCADLGYDEARERDDRKLDSFANFLEKAVRDKFTYGAISVWTDMSVQGGKVNQYALLPAGNVRLTGSYLPNGQFKVGGYMGNPKIFSALVNDAKEVVAAFTRDENTYFISNPRTDIDIYGYGYSEIEIAIRLIQGFQNALDMNIDVFNRSAIPNGILVIKGGSVTPKQLDIINRMWTNLKKGVTKSWALPVMGLSEDSEIEVLDLSRMKGNEGYYKDFMNMLAGAFCTVYKFPVHRLGYRISGHGQDSKMLPDSSTEMVDADDPGLAPLLMWLESVINEYLLWSRWPELRFIFNGKNPKEDARAYEARRNAMTFRESRIEAELPPLIDCVEEGPKKEERKLFALVMDLMPLDANLSGIAQSIAAAIFKEEKQPATPGNTMQSRTDPAKAEAHGATSGVRRDSKAESGGNKK